MIPTWLYQTVFYLVALTPWWILSLVLSHQLDVRGRIAPSPTRIFLTGLAVLYASFLLRGFLIHPANRRFKRSAHDDELPPANPKKVAVIGAGMAGLVAAKELKEEGHQVTVFERTSDWGGVWAKGKSRGGRAWASTITSTGSLNSTFSDSVTTIYHRQNDPTPLHLTRQQFWNMLKTYEADHRVFGDSLRLATEVVALNQTDDGRWLVTSTDNLSNDPTTEVFDAVTVCTGLNHEPWIPDVEGRGTFSGPELHVDDYQPDDPRTYRGKRVLVVGTGETAADLTRDLDLAGADRIVVARHGPTITLARNLASVPPDYNENRIVYSGPMAYRWGLLLSTLPTMLTNIVNPSRRRAFRARFWFAMSRFDETISKAPSVMASAGVTKSDSLWQCLDSGRAELVEPLTRITSTGAVCRDGAIVEVDAIIYCTGYRTKNSFLAGVLDRDLPSEPLGARELYKLCVHPDLDNMAVIGYARGQIGAITLSSELQARWWALLVSGKRRLPDRPQMRRHIRRLKHRSRNFSQPTRTTMTYAHSLARNDIGCEPDMFMLFRTDPGLWWQVMNGTICSAHFRLSGVHAKPDSAKRQLKMRGALHADDYVDAVDVLYGAVPLALATVPVWKLYEILLPTSSTKSALSCYV